MALDDSDQHILDFLARGGPASSTDVARLLSISRQAAHARLRALVEEGRIVREGRARATRYVLPERRWEKHYAPAGLAEDAVYREMTEEHAAVAALQGAAADAVTYVVTELVNNAIDHSGGEHVRVAAVQQGGRLTLEVEDDGVGAFAHVRRHLGLESELAAIQEISKGKTTTAPDEHTGEGLFFVSKVAAVFRLESGQLAWIVDNHRGDVAVEQLPRQRVGTLARVEIEPALAPDLRDVFDEYTEDFEFSRTRTYIKLFTIGVRFISRSEAKRLLSGLERFRQVILDFDQVRAVGQGFADEVFRVWPRAHPDVELQPVNMNEAVAFMVERARA